MKSIENKYNEFEALFPVGSKIIVIGNEPQQGDFNKLITGIVVGYEELGINLFVLYREKGKEEDSLTFSTPIPYSVEMEAAMRKLTWDERWNIYSKGISLIDKETKERKEKQNG